MPNPPFKNDFGITLREYAAIMLRVPDSGQGWLDDMIRRSMRVDLANSFLNSTVAIHPSEEAYSEASLRTLTNRAYQLADIVIRFL